MDTTPLASLPARPVLFRNRLSVQTVRAHTVDEAGQPACAEFDLVPLDDAQLTYARAAAGAAETRPAGHELALWLLAFGIRTIRGLRDQRGLPVEPQRQLTQIMGTDYDHIQPEWLLGMDTELAAALVQAIQQLSGFDRTERLRLDFI